LIGQSKGFFAGEFGRGGDSRAFFSRIRGEIAMGAFKITSSGYVPGYDVKVVHALNSIIISDPIISLIPIDTR
jgi:hypothetical protein